MATWVLKTNANGDSFWQCKNTGKTRQTDMTAAPCTPYVVSDITPFKSPIDGTIISSRSQIGEHEKKHNVKKIGNDYVGSTKPTWWDDRNKKEG
jgi:hypothetical protein